METETKHLEQWGGAESSHIALLVLDTYNETPLTRDELQTIVQQAYDQFGILAEPSLEREAERVPDLIATIRGHVDAAQAQQEANRAGLCPCGANGCSDGVPA